jgi:4-aminobutyrate aminotransferase-like enzyme
MWAFEDSGVVPDIVTMGKPIGDGHPLAAVVTTPAIAEAFARKFHYFNTFGGNPVSAAVGLAVLDVIEREQILQNVHDTGAYLADQLRSLARQHDCIADVRGKGLFYGLEITKEPGSIEPNAEKAKAIAEAMREAGVLLSTFGPHDSAIKIRPPMVLSKENADLLVNSLDQVLAGLYCS